MADFEDVVRGAWRAQEAGDAGGRGAVDERSSRVQPALRRQLRGLSYDDGMARVAPPREEARRGPQGLVGQALERQPERQLAQAASRAEEAPLALPGQFVRAPQGQFARAPQGPAGRAPEEQLVQAPLEDEQGQALLAKHETRIPHRGRLQIQGGNLEKSWPWAGVDPPTAREAEEGLADLWVDLAPREKATRHEAYKKVVNVIRQAAPGGRTAFQESYSNRNLPTRQSDHRLDIEVLTGIAFVGEACSGPIRGLGNKANSNEKDRPEEGSTSWFLEQFDGAKAIAERGLREQRLSSGGGGGRSGGGGASSSWVGAMEGHDDDT